MKEMLNLFVRWYRYKQGPNTAVEKKYQSDVDTDVNTPSLESKSLPSKQDQL